MFIHEMSESECREALQRATIARLGCARENQPYVVPIHFEFDGTCIYGFTTLGQKIEWMRTNPLVCVETDEAVNDYEWISIVVFGRYEELPDTPEFATARIQAHELLQKHAMWWEPAYIAQSHRDQPHSLTPIFYRIHIQEMTGHRATWDETEKAESAKKVSEAKRGWLDKLFHAGEKAEGQ